ncbi:unnamed protein product [Clonostachys rosea]|uniref:DUF6546 domain-containing protein n=1 Tax=Bionectria ochroleuca TaxID=29856 RepID=A0ABY6U3G7_BIOOC|nr:unnamed protein product [Clonostachys rosea]
MTSIASTEVSWGKIPAEIWLQILKTLLLDGASHAKLATVSRKWQAIVEPYNFARIKVTPARLADFNSMTYRNRHLVTYLWLCLELEEYDYLLNRVTNADNHLIASSFLKLFENLRSWDPHGNLTLDISIYSPSDLDNGFGYLTVESDILFSETLHRKLVEKDTRRPFVRACGFIAQFNSVLSKFPGEGRRAKETLVREQDALRNYSGMERATKLWEKVARENVQDPDNRLEPGHLIWQRLWTEIHYEPSREGLESGQKFRDRCYRNLVQSLPSTLKRLVLFENFNQHFVSFLSDYPLIRAPCPNLSQAIAEASLNLESLSVSYLSDASLFFDAYKFSTVWPNLRSIALTSQLLRPDADIKTINGLLEKAATAALGMPKLETLEIWNGQKGVAALLRYQPSRAALTWRATWELTISSSIIQAFGNAAPSHCGGRCDIFKELSDASLVGSHGDAIKVLKHACPILRPISLRQILTEEKFLEP